MTASPQPLRILLVEDHEVVRLGLRGLIEGDAMRVVAEAANGTEAVALYREHQPDLVVMDLHLPLKSGLAATREICQADPQARVLVLSTYEGDEDIRQALEAGARGYVLKRTSGRQILPAIEAVARGGRWVPEDLARKLAAAQLDPITEREREVLAYLARGESNKEIADLLHVTEHTVKAHVKNIMAKYQARDRTEAVTIALQRGAIHLPIA